VRRLEPLHGERPLPPKVAGLRLCAGDAVTIVTCGAGGYGTPDTDQDRVKGD
jgi:N-methylhydantoinase B/oxoprolinase/acetone carboxylase alpha subunit